MAKLDIEWLRIFVEIYRLQSVSRAAERLDLPQSNASVALNKLRQFYGDRLFSRTSAGMAPTAFSLAIYPLVVEAIQHIDRTTGGQSAFDPATAERAFCISMTDISEIVVLPRLMNYLKKHAPGIQIETERSSSETVRLLESGENDLAIGFLPLLEAGFYQQVLFKQDFVVLASSRHPRVSGGAITRQVFCGEEHIAVTTSGTGHTIVEKTLQRKRIERRISLRVPTFLSVGRLVAATDLLVVVPRRLGEALSRQEDIQMLAPPVPLPSYMVKQHWHERFHTDKGNAWLRAILARIMSNRENQG